VAGRRFSAVLTGIFRPNGRHCPRAWVIAASRGVGPLLTCTSRTGEAGGHPPRG
jgi:hypothetical protein